jgi:hypothetical protein
VTVAAASSHPTSGARGQAPAAGGDAQLASPQRVAGSEACPLCGTPLRPDQDWCLRCGAAARTRLAATPNWKTPIATIAVVAALALGVLAAALVKLAGGSGPSSAASTTTVTTPAASAPVTPTTTLPAVSTPTASTTAPSTTPGAGTPTTGASAPLPPASTNGAGTAGAGGATAGPGGKGIKLTPAEREALRRFKLRAGAK